MSLSSIILSTLLAITVPTALNRNLPSSVDNSRLKYFPPVISQIGGSCAQASYIGYMYTYEWNRINDSDASASPENRFSYFYTWNFINDGQDMGSYGYDGLQICAQNGVMSEADFPVQTSVGTFLWASGYPKYYRAMHNRMDHFARVDLKTEEDVLRLKEYLYNHWEEDGTPGGVFTFSMMASGWKMDDDYDGPSETGYHSILKALATSGGHALTIVGYDDLVESETPDGTIAKGAFIVCNSWGRYMHDNGRFYMPYWFFTRTDRKEEYLSSDVAVVEAQVRQPLLTFRVGVDCDSRNNISFSIGASEGLVAESPTLEYRVDIANQDGGPYKMQGRFASSRIDFGFDFSSALKFIGEYDKTTYFLNVRVQKKDGTACTFARLNHFSVYDYRGDPEHPKIYTYDVPGGQIELARGDNLFALPTAPRPMVSCSPVVWLGESGAPSTSPLIFRTAKGKYAKVRFSDYDRTSGKIKIRYVYSPSGGRNLEIE